jgi:electron transfer flavoprotein alpha subunit
MSRERAVWVLVEQVAGELQRASLELLGGARDIADKLDAELCAVHAGANAADLEEALAHHGADKVCFLESSSQGPYANETLADILISLIEEQSPIIVLLAANSRGQDLAPRLAAGLKTSLVSDCTLLDVSEDGRVLQTKPVYGDNAWATITSTSSLSQIATIKPGTMRAKSPDRTRKAEVIVVACETREPCARVVDYIPADPKTVSLEEAEVIVSCGRGVRSPGNVQLIEELAEVLGGSIAASRMAVDDGLVPSQRLIGMSGKTVAPRLYIACGISGAIHHTMGMRNSDTIVAINTDRNAPIFQLATVGIVGDLREVVPAITREIRRVCGNDSRSADRAGEILSDFRQSSGGYA